MRPLPRWNDAGEPSDPELRAALQDARRGPSADQIAALAARVAARAAATKGPAQTSTGVAHKRWPARRLWGGIGLCALALVAAVVSWPKSGRQTQQPVKLSVTAPRSAEAGAPVQASKPPAPAEKVAQQVPEAVPPSRSASPAVRREKRKAQSPTAVGGAVSEGDELTLLEAANGALLAQPARALALAREHEARFARGAFSEERDAIVIEALFRLGRDAEAKARRVRFDARFPSSTYKQRLDRVGGAGSQLGSGVPR